MGYYNLYSTDMLKFATEGISTERYPNFGCRKLFFRECAEKNKANFSKTSAKIQLIGVLQNTYWNLFS